MKWFKIHTLLFRGTVLIIESFCTNDESDYEYEHWKKVLKSMRKVSNLVRRTRRTRRGYVALATHGRVALIWRMNGSDRMWCKVLMFPAISHVSVSPTEGNGPTQGQRKPLTRVGFEPTTFEFEHRCSTDWGSNHFPMMYFAHCFKFLCCLTIEVILTCSIRYYRAARVFYLAMYCVIL